jgi:hypothetical protein
MPDDYDNPVVSPGIHTAHGGPVESPTEPPDPSLDEIQQHDTVGADYIPVIVRGPVEMALLPAVGWRVHHFNIDNTQVVEIAPANPRRSRLMISVRSQVAYIADTKLSCTPNDGFPVASPSNIELHHTGQVFCTGSAGAASEVGVAEEFWTR